ncbi:hypothetical protein GCM10025859_11520 [Alicyclobacillus fastidiosus]|nr:hypothetical protein GCM10025859_11520 [Alicyclobacillus fastidiosus]
MAVRTVPGSAEALPFPDHQFDLVVCESVLVFVRLPRALAEIARVLKPNGRVVDVEMMTLRPVTPEWREGVRRIYGVEHVPDLSGWRSSFQAAGFACKVLRSGPIQRLEMSDNQRDDEVADQHALSDPQVLQLIEANGRWLEANHQTMGYGVFLLNVANSPT